VNAAYQVVAAASMVGLAVSLAPAPGRRVWPRQPTSRVDQQDIRTRFGSIGIDHEDGSEPEELVTWRFLVG
jgi:hypothetical protein